LGASVVAPRERALGVGQPSQRDEHHGEVVARRRVSCEQRRRALERRRRSVERVAHERDASA
jgi:hypothetical protein